MSPQPTKWHVLRSRVIWVLIILLVPSFVIAFQASFRMPDKGPGGNAGVIFGQPIPWDTFDMHQRWIRRRFENRLGELPQGFEGMLAQSTWDRLILLHEAKRRRLRVSDEALAAVIQREPAFQERGRFVPDRYRRLLAAIGTTPQTFESLLRDDELIRNLLDATQASLTVTDDEVKTAYETRHEQLAASLLVFDAPTYLNAARSTLTDDALTQDYEAHPDAVRIPEQVVIEYAGASRDALRARTTTPTDPDLHTFYDNHPDEFAQADGRPKPFGDVRETIRTRVIDDRVSRQLKALALDLQEDADDRKTFEEIVATRALTPASAGPFAADAPRVPNGPEPTVTQTLAALPMGKLSEVMETPNGTYIGRVTQRLPAHVPPFEDVREQIRARLLQDRAHAAAKSAALALHETLKRQLAAGMRFEEAALAQSAFPVRAVRITREQPIEGIGYAPSVNAAAFALPLGTLSDVLETPTAAVIVRPEARMPADAAHFADERELLRQDLLKRKQSAQLEALLADLRAKAKLKSYVEASPAS